MGAGGEKEEVEHDRVDLGSQRQLSLQYFLQNKQEITIPPQEI